ncbi:uroporphyrin-III C-methyltransferase [Umbelopsis sp. WA50703]
MASAIRQPQPGGSLMIAWQCQQQKILVVGNNTVAASRVFSALEADANVELVGDKATMCHELLVRIEQGQVAWIASEFEPSHVENADLAFVCIRDVSKARVIVSACKVAKVPVNVADISELCDFFMTSSHRDQSLQVAVSTNGKASKLSSRIRRQIAASLPPNIGTAVDRVGTLRKRIRSSDPSDAASARRMHWLAQVCEYWSLDRLACLSEQEMEGLLELYNNDEGYESLENNNRGLPSLMPAVNGDLDNMQVAPLPRATGGTLTLVGSGPGDPSLLTVAAMNAIKEADLVLADKIVPAEVIALVKCELKIARKFPGNADTAQEEFNQEALKALSQGKNVVRLKQGDPYLFGRGGEEVLFFRSHNYECKVIPGISSSTAAPLLCGIPLTHRGVASQFLVTTGTGARNSSAPLPAYDSKRTDVFLMAVHRLKDLTEDLVRDQGYPSNLPCAILERASCSDQRVVHGTLASICQVLDSAGGSRPPGLMVTGWAINVLKKESEASEGVVKSFQEPMQNQAYHMKDSKNILTLHDPEGVC